MKLNGRKISGPNIEYIVIPRPDGNLVFKAQAVLSMKHFNELVPVPKPGMATFPGGVQKPNPDDQFYKAEVKNYNDKRYYFTIIESLRATDTLEWETVKYTEPDTWLNVETELSESGFSEQEIQYIIMGCMAANALSESKLEQARKDFLASLQVPLGPGSSQTEGQPSMPSGGPVNASL